MAVKNSLAKTNQASDVITYDSNGETVKLSKSLIKSYLVNGNGAVSDQEVTMFLSLCKFQHLNPFLREAYLIKYGSSPATVVVGKDVLLKRAMRSDKCRQALSLLTLTAKLLNVKELSYCPTITLSAVGRRYIS